MEAVELKDRRASTSGRKSVDLEKGEEDIGVSSSSWNGAPGSSQGGHRRQESHGADDEDGSELELLLDPNLPAEYSHKLRDLTRKSLSFDDNQVGVKFGESEDEEEEVENSPYPEVRAAVPNFDQDLPCNTIRAWTIGLGLIFLGASMNTIFSLRAPSISLGSLIAQIIAWPLGHGWAMFMPEREFNTFGKRWTLNPGPFNIKEHSVIVVMASVSFSVAYATDIILAQKVFYKQDFGLLWGVLLTISTQSLGYGIAGMLRRFLGKFCIISKVTNSFINFYYHRSSLSSFHDLAGKPRGSYIDARHVRAEREKGSHNNGWLNPSVPVVCLHHPRFFFVLLHPRFLCTVP